MDRQSSPTAGVSRRSALKFGGTVAAGGFLAGCTVDSDPEDDTGDGSYSVTMAPAGAVEFDTTPETWASYFPGYADMGVALGQADGLSAIGVKRRYHTGYYGELDGVSVDVGGLRELYDDGIDKELYYELDNDVHLTDPEWLLNNSFFGLEAADIDDIESAVGPFIGNTIFRRTDPWHDYRYYDMYGAFEKVAAIFDEQSRYESLRSLHDDVLGTVEEGLPADGGPNALLCFAAENEPDAFSPYRLADEGTNKKHFHDLGVSDALAGTGVDGLSTNDRGQIDYETMLEVDPEMLFVRGHEGKSREEFVDTVLAYMQEHSVASELTAVDTGAVYRGGPIYQGPIQNLFITERFANLLYPDQFSGELFDRDELAGIITDSTDT